MARLSRRSGRESAPSAPLSRIAIISDIQYADIPDGKSFHGIPRFYRNTMVALQRAVDAWKGQDVCAAMHFGDIIDGFHNKATSSEALTQILSKFDQLGVPHYHMLGNHCLYNLPRPVLNDRFKIPSPAPSPSTSSTDLTSLPSTSASTVTGLAAASTGAVPPAQQAPSKAVGVSGVGDAQWQAGYGHQPDPGASYYWWSPHPKWRFIVADGYDVSILGWPEGHPLRQQAVEILAKNNPNKDKNQPDGLVGINRRFVQFGGGASAAQLQWIRAQIEEAADCGQKVVVCCHIPFMPGTCPPVCVLYNYEEMLEVLRETRPGTVVATMCGHAHQNGYVLDEWGIHHVVLTAVLETPPGRDAYGRLDLYEDRLELVGTDVMMTVTMPAMSGGKGARDAKVAADGAEAVATANAKRNTF